MTNAEYNARVAAQIDKLRAERAYYDGIAETAAGIFADNAREQTAFIAGQMARLRATLRGTY